MSLKLSELITQAAEIERALIESGGELSHEFEQKLFQIDISNRETVDSVQFTLDRLEALADYWKMRAEGYTKIAKSLDAAHAKYKRNIKNLMAESGSPDLYGAEWRLKLIESKPKVVLDEDKLAREYFKEKITFTPDKSRIEEDLKLGVPVEGASLEPVFTLRVYPNKKEIA